MISGRGRSYYNFAYQPVRQDDVGNSPFNWNDSDYGANPDGRGCFSLFGMLKTWQKIACVLIIVAIVVLAHILIQLATQPSEKPKPTIVKENAQFERLLRGEYSPRVFNGTWISGYEFYYLDNDDNLIIFNCKNFSKTVIVDRSKSIIAKDSFDFTLSSDRKFLLYGRNFQPIFRHSRFASYEIIHIASENVIELRKEQLLLAMWAPVELGIAYVTRDQNIWYRPHPESIQDIQVTNSGSASVFNGIPDWIYEEEILESNKAMWFSNDGKKLGFVTFNDTYVPIFTLPFYGNPSLLAFQYTLQYRVHYPKVGHNNPTVQVQVADFSYVATTYSFNLTSNYLPPESVGGEPILASFTWANNTDFLLIWMNRYQNISSYQMCSTLSDSCQERFVYKQPNGWILPQIQPVFDPKGERMVSIFRIDEGGNDLYPQVVLFDFRQPEKYITPKALTRGKISVSEIAKWDTDNEIVYFISTVEGKPEQLQTQFVSSKNIESLQNYTCLSCKYETYDGNECLYSGSLFSTDGSYAAITCAGPNVPEVKIYKANSPIKMWDRNRGLRQLLKKTNFLNYKIFDVPLEKNFTARVYLNYPEIDPTQDKKYPLLVRVYSGPESALVTEQFLINFDKYYASNRSVYIATIDTRGSGLRGSRNLFTLYRKLGTVEVEDQITVIKYLIKEYKHIDPTKIGVWGWSYGGYVTGMMLATDTENLIKCGILVAPVTDWLMYDSMYTERYMGANTESDNAARYFNSSLLRQAYGLRNKMFFLIHGTRDDNVHYQNSMFLAKVLEQNDIPFRQMTYVDADHSLRTLYPHFLHSVQHFLDECFDKEKTI